MAAGDAACGSVRQGNLVINRRQGKPIIAKVMVEGDAVMSKAV